ncbi:luciferase family oxidoreductase group 1 [Pseudomonas hunanensis]|uniref:Luciferase family oxidoreductase group 1 n=1 Tax=Pseudomonas hunanensis TaxID=1247546 RepID=A0ACC6JY27_9PSED|nr:LLM class flavin-dependent oxidoreductase [Pseudomonas hunanensis]MDR6711103.1 luciferase family oxidoreductase group 1 [Pseudomonas hunanensis]
MTALSILDLIPINAGSTLARTYENSVKLAQHAEACGYRRYWLAEHHNMPGIGSSATTLLMSHLAANTSSIRIGSGGIMLPNHAPLTVAEQFGTLETLYPGRIDLGLGRAPGADGVTMRALRRSTETSADQFPSDVVEILDYFEDNGRQPVRAVPGAGQNIPVWILGSSTYGASLAAHLGLPYAFASHFAPRLIKEALQVYRSQFQPSHSLDKPYVMAGINVFAAQTRAEAEFIASSHRKWVAGVHTGNITLLPEPVEGYMQSIPPSLRASLERELAFTAIGTQEDVRSTLQEFIELTGADELMIDARIFDPAARRKSYEIAAQAIA